LSLGASSLTPLTPCLLGRCLGCRSPPASAVGMGMPQALDNMLEDKNVRLPLNLVAHGYITGGGCVGAAAAQLTPQDGR